MVIKQDEFHEMQTKCTIQHGEYIFLKWNPILARWLQKITQLNVSLGNGQKHLKHAHWIGFGDRDTFCGFCIPSISRRPNDTFGRYKTIVRINCHHCYIRMIICCTWIKYSEMWKLWLQALKWIRNLASSLWIYFLPLLLIACTIMHSK